MTWDEEMVLVGCDGEHEACTDDSADLDEDGVPDCEYNLVRNGDFSVGLSSWDHLADAQHLGVVDGALRIRNDNDTARGRSWGIRQCLGDSPVAEIQLFLHKDPGVETAEAWWDDVLFVQRDAE